MGLAWTLNKQEAQQQEPRPTLPSRVVQLLRQRAWQAGYDAALHDLAIGKLRPHFAAAIRPKKRFDSEQDAMAWATGNGHSNFTAYQCEVCGDWHLATVRR